MSFWQEVGDFFKGIGEGITGTAQGFAGNVQAGAQLTAAQAAQIQANAMATPALIQAQEEQNKRDQRTIILVLLIVFGVPMLGLATYLLFKK
jgi:hypothetical protein